MDAPSAVAVEAESFDRLRVSWAPGADEEATFFAVYTAAANDFAAAVPVALVPASVFETSARAAFLLGGLSPEQEVWFFVQSFSTDEAGDLAVSVSGETLAGPALGERKVEIDRLRKALSDFIKTVVADVEVIWRDSGGPKPAKAYVELHLAGPAKHGMDYNRGDQLEGIRTFKLTVKALADKQAVSLQLANDLQTALEREDLLEPLDVAGYSFGTVSPVEDRTIGLDTKWEGRHEFEAEVHATSVVGMENGFIETTTQTGTFT